MHKRVTFRGMKHSDAIERYANEQLDKIEKFLENERTPIYIDLVLQSDDFPSHYRIELRVKTPEYDKISNYEGHKFNDVLDRVIDVMYHELREEKKKQMDKRRGQDKFRSA